MTQLANRDILALCRSGIGRAFPRRCDLIFGPQRLTGKASGLLVMLESPFVHLYTRDIEAGLRFYRDLLGFKETFRTPTKGTPEHVELTLRGFGLGLGTVEAAKRVHGVDASPGSPAMSLVIWTENVDKTYQHLTSAGTPVVQPPHNIGKHTRNALLRDPDGNLVEIVARVA